MISDRRSPKALKSIKGKAGKVADTTLAKGIIDIPESEYYDDDTFDEVIDSNIYEEDFMDDDDAPSSSKFKNSIWSKRTFKITAIVSAGVVIISTLAAAFIFTNPFSSKEPEILPLVVIVPAELSQLIPDSVKDYHRWSSVQQAAAGADINQLADVLLSLNFTNHSLMNISTTIVTTMNNETLAMLQQEELVTQNADNSYTLHLADALVAKSRGLDIAFSSRDFKTSDIGNYSWFLMNYVMDLTQFSDEVRMAQWGQIIPRFGSSGSTHIITFEFESSVVSAINSNPESWSGGNIVYLDTNIIIPIRSYASTSQGQEFLGSFETLSLSDLWEEYGLRDSSGQTNIIGSELRQFGIRQTLDPDHIIYSNQRFIEIMQRLN